MCEEIGNILRNMYDFGVFGGIKNRVCEEKEKKIGVWYVWARDFSVKFIRGLWHNLVHVVA